MVTAPVGLWRVMWKRNGPSCYFGTASLRILFSVLPEQSHQLQCSSKTTLFGRRTPIRYEHCRQTTGLGSGFVAGSSFNLYTLSLARQLATTRSCGVILPPAWTLVRCMGSKAKEKPRGSLWRTRSLISKETVMAVHDLKRSKDSPRDLDQVFRTRIPRLLKMDMLATLDELQRQGEVDLALRLFDLVRKEIWYKPDKFLYQGMMDALARARRIAEVEKKFQELQDEGIKPEVVIYREMVGAYVRVHMLPQALEAHAKMVELGCGDDPLSLRFIEIGKEKEAVRLKQRKKAAEKLEAGEEQEAINNAVES